MCNYDIVLSTVTQQKVKSYLQDVQQKKAIPGYHFRKALRNVNPEALNAITFLKLLLSTKIPCIFAESAVTGDGSDWNLRELSILGDIGVYSNVSVFDNGLHTNPDIHESPLDANLLFVPGALLRAQGNVPADWEEVTNYGGIHSPSYEALYERRLYPLLKHANKVCSKKGKLGLITIPGLGCGQFAGPFVGQLGNKLKKAIELMLDKYANELPNIKVVYYDPYKECTNDRMTIEHMDFLVRPLTQNNHQKAQLCIPGTYEDSGDNFANLELFSVVAWDHVSWPGNDFYQGARITDDGVKAAATDIMFKITGVEGAYDKNSFRYLPPRGYGNWEEAVKAKVLIFSHNSEVVVY